MSDLYVNQRVYNRHADLFGTITAIGPCTCTIYALECIVPAGYVRIKYEWPYDPSAEPQEVNVSRLSPASIMQTVIVREW